ncbi:MAG: hypothetical protein AAF501_08760 [Pseudomonadota bacterium]
MQLFDRSLWLDSVQNPMNRLAFALLLAPFIWGVIGTMIGFVIAGLTEADGSATIDYTTDIMVVAFGFNYAFTFTLGIIGVLALLAIKQTSAASWALTGGLMGAAVAAINTFILPGQLNRGVLIFFIVMGWALFLTIRWLARLRKS